MVGKEIEPVKTNEHGSEVHPAFGMVQANRVSQAGGPHGGKVLFDSDVAHNHYIVLRVKGASRRRELHRDWIHEGKNHIEIAMSEAQWAAMVSSLNTSGTPCTINWTAESGPIPDLDFDSRLDLTHKEVKATAKRSVDKIEAAMAAYREKKTAANLRALETAIEHLPSNMDFAAKSLTEHAETVVQKTKADVEAFVIAKAHQVGLNPATWTPVEELEAEQDRKELEP